MTRTGPVLFVDDEPDLRVAAEQTLSLADLPVQLAENASAALPHITPQFDGILVTDIRMPGMDGAALMAEALARDPDLPVILVTGHGDVDLAVQSMRHGAYDFLEKPYDPARLVDTIRRALEKRRLTLEIRALREQADRVGETRATDRLDGRSAAMTAFRAQVRAVASTEADVLIEGENGTGKEVAARALHAQSLRAARPFVTVNCAALPEALVDSELFGHTAGAFPGAVRDRYGKFDHARGGTVFLDHVDALPHDMQVKLADVLQDRRMTPQGASDPVSLDIRVIAATPRDLSAAADAGLFHHELLYRLNVVTLRAPALSERREDIPALFHMMLTDAAARHGRPFPDISPQDMAALTAQAWPGNLRELNTAAERMVLGLTAPVQPAGADGLAAQMARHEAALISAALAANGGSIKATYEALGISRKALYEKMQKHNLNRDAFRSR